MPTLSSNLAMQVGLAIVVSNSLVLCKGRNETVAPARETTPRTDSGASPLAKSDASSPRPSEEEHPKPESNPGVSEGEPKSTSERAIARNDHGQADLDPSNDQVVAPPDAVENCPEKLRALGLEFTPGELPFRREKPGFPRCGSFDAVLIKKTKSGIAIRPPALMSCRMALALSELDALFQEMGRTHLGDSIVRLDQAGTYSCRKMKRFDLVSEHSYGNALDILSFTLKSGRKITVLKDFGELSRPPETPEARFLRAIGEQAFDRDLVSVSLGPYWDALHKDHFHFDLARYRVDGSRPR